MSEQLTKLSESDLTAFIAENANAVRKYHEALAEQKRRQDEVEEAARQKAHEKLIASAAYKKALSKYNNAKAAVEAACGEKEVTLSIPLVFSSQADFIDYDYEGPEFEHSEISADVAKNATGINKVQLVVIDQGLQQLVDNDNIHDLFGDWNEAQKKALADFEKAKKQIHDLCSKKEFNVTLPITFKFEVHECDWKEYGFIKSVEDIFEKCNIEAKIGATPELNKKQKKMFQDWLDDIVENACEEVYRLFHDIKKEQESAIENVNKALAEVHGLGLDWEDLEVENG